ncbi:MAG: HEAT repeat domain-containing protein [Phycisphaerales bacterium]|nr:HEAT repeat domain-containing protein [Phycisphaerales bacterium]
MQQEHHIHHRPFLIVLLLAAHLLSVPQLPGQVTEEKPDPSLPDKPCSQIDAEHKRSPDAIDEAAADEEAIAERVRAFWRLASRGVDRADAADQLCAVLADPAHDVRFAAASILAKWGQVDARVAEVLVAALGDSDHSTRLSTRNMLWKADAYGVEALCSHAHELDTEGRLLAVELLGDFGNCNSSIRPTLLHIAKTDPNANVRQRAIWGLGGLDHAALDALDVSRTDENATAYRGAILRASSLPGAQHADAHIWSSLRIHGKRRDLDRLTAVSEEVRSRWVTCMGLAASVYIRDDLARVRGGNLYVLVLNVSDEPMAVPKLAASAYWSGDCRFVGGAVRDALGSGFARGGGWGALLNDDQYVMLGPGEAWVTTRPMRFERAAGANNANSDAEVYILSDGDRRVTAQGPTSMWVSVPVSGDRRHLFFIGVEGERETVRGVPAWHGLIYCAPVRLDLPE